MIIVDNAVDAQVQVNAGWNMIGAITTIQASAVITVPPGIIVSPFYGFNTGSGYYVATTLQMGQGYWVKVNGAGIINGFVPAWQCGFPISYEYKYYGTVQIGTQCWFKENLDVGEMIPGSQNQQNNLVIEKYCYDDNETNCQLYGGLYQWDEAMQYVTNEGAQGICPPGWHIPTLAEFQTLSAYVGGDGNALKAVGQGTGDGAGTNSSGFSALLAGNRGLDGGFYNLGGYTYFWSSSEYPASTAYTLRLGYGNSIVDLNLHNKEYGFSVRCVKD